MHLRIYNVCVLSYILDALIKYIALGMPSRFLCSLCVVTRWLCDLFFFAHNDWIQETNGVLCLSHCMDSPSDLTAHMIFHLLIYEFNNYVVSCECIRVQWYLLEILEFHRNFIDFGWKMCKRPLYQIQKCPCYYFNPWICACEWALIHQRHSSEICQMLIDRKHTQSNTVEYEFMTLCLALSFAGVFWCIIFDS